MLRGMKWTAQSLVVAFVAGGIGGALCDQIHVQSSTLWYPHPWIAGQAWWVGPQFGIAVIAILTGATAFAQRMRRTPATMDFVTGGAWFLGAYAASAVFGGHPAALLAIYLATFAARLAVNPDRVPVLGFSLLLAIGGTLYEGTLSSLHGFYYAHPDVYHVGMWLPGIYLHGAPLALAIARRASQTVAASASTVAASSRTSA